MFVASHSHSFAPVKYPLHNLTVLHKLLDSRSAFPTAISPSRSGFDHPSAMSIRRGFDWLGFFRDEPNFVRKVLMSETCQASFEGSQATSRRQDKSAAFNRSQDGAKSHKRRLTISRDLKSACVSQDTAQRSRRFKGARGRPRSNFMDWRAALAPC